MPANTKLDKSQKEALIVFCEDFPKAAFYNNKRVTLCCVPEFKNSKMVRVSVSIMSETEEKFREKVGKYHAAWRMINGEYIVIPSNFYTDSLMESLG